MCAEGRSIYILVMLTHEKIKTWLRQSGMTRAELASKLMVTKRTVDGWLSSGNPIPAKKLAMIERLMRGLPESTLPLPADFEIYVKNEAEKLKKNIDDFVIAIIKKAMRKTKYEGITDIVELALVTDEATGTGEAAYYGLVIGNVAAGPLCPGDTEPYEVELHRPLRPGEFLLKVEGHSMEPVIFDGDVVIMRPHVYPPAPPVGAIVEYYDERGVTLKQLGVRDNNGVPEYVLHSINPEFDDILPLDGGRIGGVFVERVK